MSPLGIKTKEENTMENAMNKLWLETLKKINELIKLNEKLCARYDCVAEVESSERFETLSEETQDKVYDYLYKLNKRIDQISETIDELRELRDKLDEVEGYLTELEGVA